MDADKIKQILKEAFKPFHCEVDFPDFGGKMSFRVFNEKNETIFTIKDVETGWRFGHEKLDSIIRSAKKEIKKKDYVID